MTMQNKRFSVEHIIARAEEMSIHLSVQSGDLVIRAGKGKVSPQALEVFRQYKPELIKALTPLCSTCLDAGMETPALDEAYDELTYCLQHHPLYNGDQEKRQFTHAVSQVADAFVKGCTVHFDPPGYTIQDRAREIVIAERAKYKAKRVLLRREETIDLNAHRKRL